ncbi:MAG: DUF4352 domain-containing protein [Ruminococcus sp.]|nr:DUF4352 domain-containing protein [Ruminococcus sp.]
MSFQKIAALVCGLTLLGTAVGCSEKDTVKPAGENSGGAVQAPTEVSRVTQIGNVGEMSAIGDVEVTVNKLYRSEYYGAQKGVLTNIIFLDVTVTNHSDEPIDANMLTSFEFDVDGEPYNTATLQAISSAQKQFGEELNLFTEKLEVGESQTGCVAAEVPNNFNEITLYCLPLGGADEHYDISQAITYTFTEDSFEALAMPPLQKESTSEAQE